MDVVVVGVDGSQGSRAALAWAAAEARARGAQLRVVLAWEYPSSILYGGAFAVAGGAALSEVPALAEERLEALLAELAPEFEGVEVRRRAVRGPAGRALVDASREADLLVVGSRGHGGFAEFLLGSVSRHCVHYARCPVAIVPSRKQHERKAA